MNLAFGNQRESVTRDKTKRRRLRAFARQNRSPRRQVVALPLSIFGLVILLLALSPVAAQAALSSVADNDWVTNGPVTAIARSGNTIYLGGSFSQIGPRSGPAVTFTSESNTPDASFPQVSGGFARVNAAVSDGAGGWYIAGSFTHVGDVARAGLAHVMSGGTVDPTFAPNPEATEFGAVSALALSGSTLYIGGEFTKVNGTARHGLAAISISDGSLESFNPGPASNGFQVDALAVASGVLYVGGTFAEMSGTPRANLAAFTVSTGALTSWAPQATGTGGSPIVRALVVSGSTVYLAGSFDHVAGEARSGFAAVDTSGALQSWNPEANGCTAEGFALAVNATAVYTGGCFTNIGGQSRSGFAALDPTTGKATSWNPQASGGIVEGIAISGSTVYASGGFTTIGGQSRNGLAALDSSTAEARAWNPNLNLDTNPGESTEVFALATSGTQVFAGGTFSSVGGVARTDLAAINATTGEATAWSPGLTPFFPLPAIGDSPIHAISVAAGVVYVGGTFSSAGGQPREDLAALDPTTGNATSWNPGAASPSHENTVVAALVATPSTVYVGGSFTTLGGSTRSNLGTISTSTGLATAWNPQLTAVKADTEHGTAAVSTLTLSGTTIYAGGGLTSAGGHTRTAAAAFSTETGEATAWDPLIEAGFGTPYATGLALSGSTVYIVGAFSTTGLLAVDALSGALREGYAPVLSSDSFNTVATGNSAVYLPSGAAFDSNSGQALAWQVPLSGMVFGTPTEAAVVLASGNHVYLAGGFRSTELAAAAGFAAFTIQGPVNTAPPTITGTAAEGQTLTEHHGSWTGTTSSFVYQWVRCKASVFTPSCVPISGATGPSYALTEADARSTIEVLETATNVEGASDPVGSAATAAVLTRPANTAPPTVTGTPVVGQTLTCSPGSWTEGPTEYQYSWLRDFEAIPGATSPTYTISESDAGHELICEVIAVNSAGSAQDTANVGLIEGGGGGAGGGGSKTGGGQPGGGDSLTALPPPTSCCASTPIPLPILGQRQTVTVLAGTVSVRLKGASRFEPFSGARTIPDGSEVDATNGRVLITVATLTPGQTQSAEVYGGRFLIHQDHTPPGETHLTLSLPLTGCPRTTLPHGSAASLAISAKRRSGPRARHLWVSEKGGSWATNGRYVSTTVEGTSWLTQDECNQSLVQVATGKVKVDDLVRHKTRTLIAGHRYTAKRR
jgi:hypothetical protein